MIVYFKIRYWRHDLSLEGGGGATSQSLILSLCGLRERGRKWSSSFIMDLSAKVLKWAALDQ